MLSEAMAAHSALQFELLATCHGEAAALGPSSLGCSRLLGPSSGALVLALPSSSQQAPTLGPGGAGPATGEGAGGAAASGAGAASHALVPYNPAQQPADVPVPTLFLGKLYSPIPAGSHTLSLGMLEASKELGVDPPIPLPSLEDQLDMFTAARWTDPLSAYNIVQGTRVEGKTAVLVERGLAEQLARGRVQMTPAKAGSIAAAPTPKAKGGGFNPFAALRRLGDELRARHEITGSVREAVKGLWPSPGPGGSKQAGPSASSPADAPGKEPTAAAPSAAAAATGVAAQQGGKADGQSSPSAEGQQAEHGGGSRQFALQHTLGPLGLLPAPGAAPPQLAILPVRVALSLLAGMPRHFLLLADADQGDAAALKGASRGRRRAQRAQQGPPAGSAGRPAGKPEHAATGEAEGSGSASPRVFNGTDTLAGVKVYTVAGFAVNQSAGEGGTVQFTPAFLSPGQLRRFWRGIQVLSGTTLMYRRRVMRGRMTQRLERAAAIIAAGGGGGGGGSSAFGGDDEDAGFDEPPEIQQFIQEIGQAMGPLGGMGAAGPPRGLARVAATVACGAVSLAARFLNWAGNVGDAAVMATPLGPRLLGIPQEATIEEHSLPSLLASCRAYNRQGAAQAALLAPTEGAVPVAGPGGEGEAGEGRAGGGAPGSSGRGGSPDEARGANEGGTASGSPAAGEPAEVAREQPQPAEVAREQPPPAAADSAAEPESQHGVEEAISPSPAGTSTLPSAEASPISGASQPGPPGSSASQREPAAGSDSSAAAEAPAAAAASAVPDRDSRGEGEAGGAGSAAGAAAPQQAASLVSQAAAETFSKQLAAAGVWLAVAGMLALDSSSGVPQALRPLLGGAPSAEAPLEGLEGLQTALPGALGDERSAALAVLSQVLPTLEHNGLESTLLRGGPGHSRGRGPWEGGSESEDEDLGRALGSGLFGGSIEEAVQQHASPELSLQIVHARSKDWDITQQLPPSVQRPLGKGLILVGDLDQGRPGGLLGGRPRGGGLGGGRRLLLGVDDGAKLLGD